MRQLFTGICWFLLALYPLIVFFGLQRLPLQYLAMVLLGLGLARVVSLRAAQGGALVQSLLAVVLIMVVLTALVADSPEWFKFYPVGVNCAMLAIFFSSLFYGMPMIERFARIAEPNLPPAALAYTRKVTVVWCVFFLANAAVALFTAVYASYEVWALYNGLIAYLLMGILFTVEWLFRRRIRGADDAQPD
jgi:uncharacterized membrane protein